MSIIALGSNKIKYLYYLFASLSYIFRNYSEHVTGFQLKTSFKLFFMFLGMSLNLIPECILSRKFKNNRKVHFSTYHSVLKIMLSICGISLLDYLGFFLTKYFEQPKFLNEAENQVHGLDHLHCLLEFAEISILTFYFLKLRLKRHHIFFLLLMICGYLFIILSNLFNNRKVTAYIIALIFRSIFYGIIIVIEKWLMEYKFLSPYFLMGHMGVIGLFYSIIILIFMLSFKIDIDVTIEDLTKFKEPLVLLTAFLFTIFSMGYNIFLLLINKIFGPPNRIVYELVSIFIIFVIDLIVGNLKLISLPEGIFLFIGNIISLFGSFGFNEIIILYICNIQRDTEKEVLLRSTFIGNNAELPENLVLTKKKTNEINKMLLEEI